MNSQNRIEIGSNRDQIKIQMIKSLNKSNSVNIDPFFMNLLQFDFSQ
jgi:hypothetical protein